MPWNPSESSVKSCAVNHLKLSWSPKNPLKCRETVQDFYKIFLNFREPFPLKHLKTHWNFSQSLSKAIKSPYLKPLGSPVEHLETLLNDMRPPKSFGSPQNVLKHPEIHIKPRERPMKTNSSVAPWKVLNRRPYPPSKLEIFLKPQETHLNLVKCRIS